MRADHAYDQKHTPPDEHKDFDEDEAQREVKHVRENSDKRYVWGASVCFSTMRDTIEEYHPVDFKDGCFMYRGTQGVMLVTVTLDSNHQISVISVSFCKSVPLPPFPCNHLLPTRKPHKPPRSQ